MAPSDWLRYAVPIAAVAGAVALLIAVRSIGRQWVPHWAALRAQPPWLRWVAMLALASIADPPPLLTILLFATIAGVLSAASNLVYVYLPELFPTDLRASGIGLAIAASRIGSAASTFLLPLVVADFGVRVALGSCVIVLAVGAIVCLAWAPETKHVRLAAGTATP